VFIKHKIVVTFTFLAIVERKKKLKVIIATLVKILTRSFVYIFVRSTDQEKNDLSIIIQNSSSSLNYQEYTHHLVPCVRYSRKVSLKIHQFLLKLIFAAITDIIKS